MNKLKNNLKVEVGTKDIQDFSDVILDNELYTFSDSMNCTIARIGKEKSKKDFMREITYSLIKIDDKPVALCMFVKAGAGISEKISDDKNVFYSDSFFSIFVKKEHRGAGLAHIAAKELSQFCDKKLLLEASKHNKHMILASKSGAWLCRKYFSIATVCGGLDVFYRNGSKSGPWYSYVDIKKSVERVHQLSNDLEFNSENDVQADSIDDLKTITHEFERQENNLKALLAKSKKQRERDFEPSF